MGDTPLLGSLGAPAQAAVLLAIDAIPDAIAVWDADDRLVAANAAFRRWLGEGGFGAGTSLVDILRDALRAGCLSGGDGRPDQQLAAERAAWRTAGTREVRTGDGRWLLLRSTSAGSEPGGGWVSIATDITALKTREEGLSRAQQREAALAKALAESAEGLEAARREAVATRVEAEAASRAKTYLLARVSHELRTPLNAIIGFSEILKSELFGPLGDPRYVDYSRDVHDSGSHLLGLIDDIIDLSRLESGTYRLEETRFDLADPLAAALRLLRHAAERKGVSLFFSTQGCPWVVADERAMRQIAINLLGNAVKFTQSGGKVQVRVERTTDGDVEVRIADTGIGIPDQDQPRLFLPFVRASNTEHLPDSGSGLGLTIVRSLVERHGGTIHIASRLGIGTTVTVRLPGSRVIDAEVPFHSISGAEDQMEDFPLFAALEATTKAPLDSGGPQDDP